LLIWLLTFLLATIKILSVQMGHASHFRHLHFKELLNSMGFDPYNRSVKVQKSIGTPTPKVGVHLGLWGFLPSHFPTLPGAWNVTFELPFWHAPLQALALVANLSLGLRQCIYECWALRFQKPKPPPQI